jgi:hypothetical protein
VFISNRQIHPHIIAQAIQVLFSIRALRPSSTRPKECCQLRQRLDQPLECLDVSILVSPYSLLSALNQRFSLRLSSNLASSLEDLVDHSCDLLGAMGLVREM